MIIAFYFFYEKNKIIKMCDIFNKHIYGEIIKYTKTENGIIIVYGERERVLICNYKLIYDFSNYCELEYFCNHQENCKCPQNEFLGCDGCLYEKLLKYKKGDIINIDIN